ncbi:MAG: SDR family NAD(P)-dependent oxidoreductase [Proteobacteria bacterium]|nr:MAG: SDR family NAD(P)-dependent oxidoreductase [Pseudomonadota bacterium]
MNDLTDPRRVVLVTGCSSGIGRAIALGLPRDRYRVFATARKSRDVDLLRKTGLEATALDLADSDSIHAAVDHLLAASCGRLYALVNNGAYGQPGAVEDLSREALRLQFETNVFGTHELTRAVLPTLRAGGQGRIIQISSILGRVSLANRGAYNASKHALEALSDTLRLELSGSGVSVSLVEPGPIESRFRANALTAFQRHVDTEKSVHAPLYAAVVERLGNTGTAPFTLPADSLLKPVRHALESPRPRARYPITIPARVLPAIKRFLTDRTMDRILRAVGDRPPAP